MFTCAKVPLPDADHTHLLLQPVHPRTCLLFLWSRYRSWGRNISESTCAAWGRPQQHSGRKDPPVRCHPSHHTAPWWWCCCVVWPVMSWRKERKGNLMRKWDFSFTSAIYQIYIRWKQIYPYFAIVRFSQFNGRWQFVSIFLWVKVFPRTLLCNCDAKNIGTLCKA